MIQSFKSKKTERFFEGNDVKNYRSFAEQLERRLLLLDNAEQLRDLRNPPSNRFERLIGDRKGQYSIRINKQWRIRFGWEASGPIDVEVVDYH